MRTSSGALVVLCLFVASCGDGVEASRVTSTTVDPHPQPGGPVEVFSPAEMDSVSWWEPLPGEDLLVYARNVAGAVTIATVDANAVHTALVEGVASESAYRLTPDGSSLVVVEPSAGRGWSVWTVPSTGGEPKHLALSVEPISMGEVTPDSVSLLYRTLGQRPSLQAVSLDGVNSITLATTLTGDVEPVMGPPTIVGDRAVFATHDEGHGVRLWTSHVARPERTLLSMPPGVRTVWQIIAADDGRHALVEAKVDGLSSERALFAVWADGRGPAVLLDEGGVEGVSGVRPAGDDALYRVGADWYSAALSGSVPMRIPDPVTSIPDLPTADAVEAAADGTYVFTSAESGLRELYHFDPQTDSVTLLNGELPEHRDVLGGKATDWVLDFALLGDGRHVAYTTGLAGNSVEVPYHLFIAPLP